MDNLKNIVTAATEQATIKKDTAPVDKTETKKGPNQATELLGFIIERVKLFHDENKTVFALEKETQIVRRLHSTQFKDWLTAIFYNKEQKSIRDNVMREALSTLSGIGLHKGKLENVHVRVAKYKDEYYLDLCQPDNSRAVKIVTGCWEVVESPPVRFVRSDAMQPLPTPSQGGNIDDLWNICNIPEASQLLAITWLAECLRPETPYPVLELLGEQGSAKSTTQSALRRIIDPNSCDLRGISNKPDDVFVSSTVNHIMSYENVSHLPPSMQDAFCIIATGGGHAKRQLYKDTDEIVIQAKNPIIINGISAVVTAQDLIDRSITIELPIIKKRSEITTLWPMFENKHGLILGGLLDIFVKALALLPNISLPSDEVPRLVEFARFGVAIAKAMNPNGAKFLSQFKESRQEAIARTIDASPVASALIEWFEKGGKKKRELTVKNLLSELDLHRPQGSDAWPKSAKGLGDALRRTAPALRQLDIECRSLGKQGSNVNWEIGPKEKLPNQSLQCRDVLQKEDLKTLKTSISMISSDVEEF